MSFLIPGGLGVREAGGVAICTLVGVGTASAATLLLLKRDRNRTRLRMELREGRNRQIRRMMARMGHPVKRLRRVQLGPLKLKGLRVGEWREPTSAEMAALKRAAYGGKEKGIKRRA